MKSFVFTSEPQAIIAVPFNETLLIHYGYSINRLATALETAMREDLIHGLNHVAIYDNPERIQCEYSSNRTTEEVVLTWMKRNGFIAA